MNKLILFTITMSLVAANSAFAKNLGILGDEQIPQTLVSATEFAKQIDTPMTTESREWQSNIEMTDDQRLRQNSNSFWGGYWGGLGYGGWGSYYGYPSYYYPYYSYGGYYSPWTYGWYLNENESGTRSSATRDIAPRGAAANAPDLANTPVVCFASDSSGNWFAHADLASQVVSVQQVANTECLASGESCSQNLGCAIAYGDR